jgi:hypothetical protein
MCDGDASLIDKERQCARLFPLRCAHCTALCAFRSDYASTSNAGAVWEHLKILSISVQQSIIHH